MPATIDEALEILEDSGPEYAGGLANHGPMAAEALFALGRPDAVIPWVEGYKRRLREHPEARNPIVRDEWREALGDGGRVGDWIAFFDRELADAPWQGVLNEWATRLAPGLIAAATHGAIRTGHAVRALSQGETPQRRHELAEGLAYWAARYQRLPGATEDGTATGTLPSQAIQRIEVLPPEQQAGLGLITHALAKLDGYTPFASVIDLVDASVEPSRFLSDLTETFAGVYLANADGGHVIGFIHAVTGPSAVRLLAPHLSQETTALALRYAWQAGAAIYTALGRTAAPPSFDAAEQGIDDLVDRAVATSDEHAIKFTEACLREHALNPQPVYLAAARDATARLSRS